MQGQLRNEPLTINIDTECAQSGQPLHITLGSDMACQVEEQDASPLFFTPMVNFSTLADPNIIDAF